MSQNAAPGEPTSGTNEGALVLENPQNNADFTGASLKYSQVLGYNRVHAKSIEHVNDEAVCYLSGKHVAIYNYETKSHRFILKNSRTAEIVAFCVSANRRYIALSERLIEDSGVQVSVYNFATASRVRTLVMSYISKQPVIALSFSLDNKYLATVTSPPEVYVYLWQLDKARLLGTQDVPTPLTSISISPWAHWQLCATGPRDVILWKFQPSDAKRLKRSDPLAAAKTPANNVEAHYTCHAWFDKESVLVGTQEGDVIVVVKGEVKTVLTGVHGGLAVRCLGAVGRGFVCAGDRGYLSLFERTYDKGVFQLYRRVVVSQTRSVTDVSLSPSEDGVVCALDDNTILHLALSNLDLVKNEHLSACRPLPIGFHNDTVTAIDICVQRSVVLTASTTGVVRLWNYLRKVEEISSTFDDEVVSAAIHPTGTRAVIGLRYRMGVYGVLRNDFHLLCELPVKNCRGIRFSHGGQYFVALVLNRILVFDSHTFETVGTLQGHGSMVRCVTWLPDDSGLVSAGLEGGLYVWKLDGMRRCDEELILKTASWTALAVDPTTKHIFALCTSKGSDGPVAEGEISLRELNVIEGGQGTGAGGGGGSMEVATTSSGLGISSRASNSRMASGELALSAACNTLFVGTPNGQLLLFRYPLVAGAPPYQRYEVCAGEVLFVRLTPDERYLCVVGADNVLYFFEVDVVVSGRPVKRRAFNHSVFDDISYVLVAEDEERLRKVAELELHVEDLARGRDQDAERLRHDHREMIKSLEAAHAAELSALKNSAMTAEEKAVAAQTAATDQIHKREGVHIRALEEVEMVYEKRASEQEKVIGMLQAEKEDAVVAGEMRVNILQKAHEEEVAQLKEELELERKLRQMDHEQAARDDAALREAHLEELRQLEEDHDQLIEEVRLQDQTKVDQATAAARKANQRTSEIRTKFEERERQMLDLKKRVSEADQTLQRKAAKIEEFARAQRALKKDVDVREDTIAASERKIHDLKKQCAELEKLRYVLTFKYNELRKEVAPKDAQISRLSGRVGEMDRELERLGHDTERYKQALGGKSARLQTALEEGSAASRRVEVRTRLFDTLLRDLAELVADPELAVRHPPQGADGNAASTSSAAAPPGVALPPLSPSSPAHASASSPAGGAATAKGVVAAVGAALGRKDARQTHDLRKALMGLVESYQAKSRYDGPAPQKDSTEEFQRQRESLELQMAALRKQRLRREEHLRVDRHRKTIENVLLVQQVNELRQERKQLQVKVANAEHDAVQSQLSRRVVRGPAAAGKAPGSPTAGGGGGGGNSPTAGAHREAGGAAAAAVPRGRLHKGSTVTMRDLAVADPQRIAEIITQVDRNHREMQRQQEEIRRLRTFVHHLLARAAVGGADGSAGAVPGSLLGGLPGGAAAEADALGVDLTQGDGGVASPGDGQGVLRGRGVTGGEGDAAGAGIGNALAQQLSAGASSGGGSPTGAEVCGVCVDLKIDGGCGCAFLRVRCND